MALKETKTKREKQRNQVKSRFYYIFWGAATVSVFAGQLYVGSGYRMYSRALMKIFESVRMEFVEEDPYRHPIMRDHYSL